MSKNIKPGDRFELSHISQNDVHGRGRLVKAKYEVLQVFPHFVLCRKLHGGYRECFDWHQMRVAMKTS